MRIIEIGFFPSIIMVALLVTLFDLAILRRRASAIVDGHVLRVFLGLTPLTINRRLVWRCSFWEMVFASFSADAALWIPDNEGVTWIRGWYRLDSPEVHALLARHALHKGS